MRSHTRQDRQSAAISGCLIQQNIRACASRTRWNRTLATNTRSSILIQLIPSQILRPISRTRLTTASTIMKGWSAQAAARGTMFHLPSPTGISTQMRIMKSIHSLNAKRRKRERKPQINNNTAINGDISPIHNHKSSRLVIKCRLSSRHSRPISSRTCRSEPSTGTIRFIPTAGICCLKIMCEGSREIFIYLFCALHLFFRSRTLMIINEASSNFHPPRTTQFSFD